MRLGEVASYLLVANETAESQELLHTVSEIHAEDPGAEFVIVVPATPLNLLQQFEGTAKSARGLAAQRAQSTRQKLESLGIRIRSTRVGNWDPYVAIEEELLHENMRQSWYQRCRLDCHVGFEWTYRPGSSVATQVSARPCGCSICGGPLHIAVAELKRLTAWQPGPMKPVA